MIQTSSSIPFPGTAAQGRPQRYPWRTMKVGESFPVDLTLASARSNASNAMARLNHGSLFRAAEVKGKVRIWRLK